MPEFPDSQSETDEVVFRRYISGGDNDALGELIRRYAGLVYSAARRQVRDPHLAEDVMQNVFVTFVRRAREVRSVAALGTWLLQTTRYTSANAVRTDSRRRTHERAAWLSRPQVASAANPVEASIANEQSQWDLICPLLDEAISRLAGADQTVVVLRFLRGLSLREVGRATGTTEEGARKRIQRAIERLRNQLAKLGVLPTDGGSSALGAILAARVIEPVPATAVSQATAAAASAAGSAAGSIIQGALTMSAITKLVIASVVSFLLFAGGLIALHLAGVSLLSDGSPPILLTPKPVAAPTPPAALKPIVGGTWQNRFNSVYALAPGQALKLVARPYIPERREWYRATESPQQVRAIANPSQIIFEQAADGTLHWQYLFANDDVRSIALNVTGLRAWQVAGDLGLLRRRIRGDWVFSATATTDNILGALAATVAQQTGGSARFVHNRVDRDVIVVSGQLRPDQGRFDSPRIKLEMTDQQLLAHSKNGGGDFASKGGNVDYLLDNLSQATETPFIDERCIKTYQLIMFGATQSNGTAAAARGLAPDKTLLDSLAQQTGLSFTPERRNVDIWTLSN